MSSESSGRARARTARAAAFLAFLTGMTLGHSAPGLAQSAAAPARESASVPVYFPDDPLRFDADDLPIPMPEERGIGMASTVKKSLDHPDGQGPRALNINTLGEVPNSSWFTNRHGRREMSDAALAQGPDREGPPASGRWKVIGHPGAGKTAKVTIEDPEGRRFLIKFETPDNPEMMSAAEVVCTKFFHAFGYWVPENHIVVFDPVILFVDPELDPQEFPANDLEELLASVPRTPDGQVRAIASSWLPGKPLGPFAYSGTRPDDPNDVFPHQDRRELRGLKVFAAWLNHSDIKPQNTLDMYVGDDGAGHVRHHLIDFGSCLGSGAQAPKDRLVGYERYLDVGGILKGVFTFGLWSHPAMAIDYPDYPGIGHFEGDYYQPWLWKAPVPNPAFARMDAADAFWAAAILARFDDDAIADIVAQGRFTDPREERYLIDTLITRRDKTIAHWLTATNPLDGIRLDDGRIVWDNAAERQGLAAAGSTYTARWHTFDNETGETTPVSDPASAADPATGLKVPTAAWGPEDRFGIRHATVEIRTAHPDFPHWDRPVQITVRNSGNGIELVGVARPRTLPPDPAS